MIDTRRISDRLSRKAKTAAKRAKDAKYQAALSNVKAAKKALNACTATKRAAFLDLLHFNGAIKCTVKASAVKCMDR